MIFSARSLLIPLMLVFAGCTYLKPAKTPLETTWLAKQQTNQKLLLLLPGMGDDLHSFQDNNIAQLVNSSCPDVDILYADAYFAYYRNRSLLKRLQQDVLPQIEGYDSVYELGVSMGGLGVLLSAREYHGQVDGLILVAPYLGDEETLSEIASDGGIAKWEMSDPDNDFALLWQWIQSRRTSPLFTSNTHLLTGNQDARYESHQIVRSMIPENNFVTVDGGHKWRVWNKALSMLFSNESCPI